MSAAYNDCNSGRFLHSTCVVGRDLLVWGGHDDEDVFDDLHLLDTDTMQWRPVECEGESPGPRYAAESVTLADDLVLVYGGKDDSKAFNDLHLLRFTSAGTFSFCVVWYMLCVCRASSASC
jgi:hypothetical protein